MLTHAAKQRAPLCDRRPAASQGCLLISSGQLLSGTQRTSGRPVPLIVLINLYKWAFYLVGFSSDRRLISCILFVMQ